MGNFGWAIERSIYPDRKSSYRQVCRARNEKQAREAYESVKDKGFRKRLVSPSGRIVERQVIANKSK